MAYARNVQAKIDKKRKEAIFELVGSIIAAILFFFVIYLIAFVPVIMNWKLYE
jgi:ABC-type multidrug transport system permease subunit